MNAPATCIRTSSRFASSGSIDICHKTKFNPPLVLAAATSVSVNNGDSPRAIWSASSGPIQKKGGRLQLTKEIIIYKDTSGGADYPHASGLQLFKNNGAKRLLAEKA